MKITTENEEHIERVFREIQLLNSILLNIFISLEEGNGLVIELNFENKFAKTHPVFKIKFLEVIEYGFYYNTGNFFYNVESYKFIILEDRKFYLSLDPFDELKKISEQDQDFILAKGINFDF